MLLRRNQQNCRKPPDRQYRERTSRLATGRAHPPRIPGLERSRRLADDARRGGDAVQRRNGGYCRIGSETGTSLAIHDRPHLSTNEDAFLGCLNVCRRACERGRGLAAEICANQYQLKRYSERSGRTTYRLRHVIAYWICSCASCGH